MSGQQINYSFHPMLFTVNTGDSMLFVIKPCKDKETLRNMIEYGGGEVVSTPGDHGITLIPPEVEVIGDDEVYSVEYIKDCCKRNKVQDLKLYRLNPVSRFPRSFDVMDILLRNTTWSAALKGHPLTEQTVRTAEPSGSSTELEKSKDSSKLEEVVPEVDDVIIGESQDETGRSRDEDTSTGSSGRQLRNLRNSNTVSFRETQSAKATEQTVRTAEPSGSGTELEKSKDSSKLEEVVPEVDDVIIGESQDETGRSRDEDTSTGSSGRQLRNLRSSNTVSFRETQSAKAFSNDSEGEVVSDDDDELWNLSAKRLKTSLRIPRRRDYTRKEKLAIINFITKYRFHKYVKGREVWQKAEAAQICPNRTWQSMKEHFIKQIIPNIKTYDLSEEEICKFQNPFC